ncbi:hypothetical protein [Cupriavidus sp. OTU4054]|uniref:hypothetical protein n=1 Tax=Cupriavidus sp. OTU4054 TaxID=3043853 RepID=UPI00313EEA14
MFTNDTLRVQVGTEQGCGEFGISTALATVSHGRDLAPNPFPTSYEMVLRERYAVEWKILLH